MLSHEHELKWTETTQKKYKTHQSENIWCHTVKKKSEWDLSASLKEVRGTSSVWACNILTNWRFEVRKRSVASHVELKIEDENVW